MILIVESGSTKSDWIGLNGEEKSHFTTMGLNPYFHDEQTVFNAVKGNSELFALASNIQRIFFYGAGCSDPLLNQIIEKGLQRAFPQANVKVDHDLTACAYSTFKGEPLISCIIGTGSNSCFYDGNTVSEAVPALGYILGDEGSGSFFGKRLLADFLYHKLPQQIQNHLSSEQKLDKSTIVEHVYRKPNANVYLASFMPVVNTFRQTEYIQKLLHHGFGLFLEEHVQCYTNYQSVKTSFVGSVAAIFEEELKNACLTHQVNCGEIIRKPIDGLVRYHQQFLVKERS
jgi:glucosamine kinase